MLNVFKAFQFSEIHAQQQLSVVADRADTFMTRIQTLEKKH